MTTIDWTNPKIKISKYFTVHESCWLPSWGKYHIPTPAEQANILKVAKVMDQIRDFLQCPIKINCWIRPVEYNKFIGGAPSSMHITGGAVDWTTGKNCDCDNLRKLLLPRLVFWGIRMEWLDKSTWVHIDIKKVEDRYRYFKP